MNTVNISKFELFEYTARSSEVNFAMTGKSTSIQWVLRGDIKISIANKTSNSWLHQSLANVANDFKCTAWPAVGVTQGCIAKASLHGLSRCKSPANPADKWIRVCMGVVLPSSPDDLSSRLARMAATAGSAAVRRIIALLHVQPASIPSVHHILANLSVSQVSHRACCSARATRHRLEVVASADVEPVACLQSFSVVMDVHAHRVNQFVHRVQSTGERSHPVHGIILANFVAAKSFGGQTLLELCSVNKVNGAIVSAVLNSQTCAAAMIEASNIVRQSDKLTVEALGELAGDVVLDLVHRYEKVLASNI